MTAPRAHEPLPEIMSVDEIATLSDPTVVKVGGNLLRRLLASHEALRRAPSADTRRLVATAFREGAKWDARNSHLSYYGWHDAMNIAAKKYADAAMTQEGE